MINQSIFNNSSKLKRLTGLDKDQFDNLCTQVSPLWQQAEAKRLSRSNRKRALGAGRRYFLSSIEEKVLCLLVWLKLYPSYWFLGFMFGLDASNAMRLCRRIKPLVKQAADVDLDKRLSGINQQIKRRKITCWEELQEDFPEVAEVLIDAMEQPVRRPKQVNKKKAKSKQKKYYSGKKKRHTIKAQVSVNTDGLILDLSKSVPGSVHDYKLLKQSGLMEDIPLLAKKITDTGYDGMKTDFSEHWITQPIKRRRGSPPLTRGQKKFNRSVSQVRILVEHVISKIKKYQVISDVYRNRTSQHNIDLQTVAALINYRLTFS